MDLAQTPRRSRRARSFHRRLRSVPMRLEVLEERSLLSLSLINDINPVPQFPAQITGAGANVYFVTQAADGGADLDVKTGAGTTVVKEFAGAGNSISDLTPDGSKLFFVANLNKGGQLWVTNGTRAGTKLLRNPGPGARFGDMTVVGNELYLASELIHGKQATDVLFKSNGTAAGTGTVTLPASALKSGPFYGDLAEYDGWLYFGAGVRLMKTNGVATKVAGTFGPPHYDPIEDGGVADLTVAGGLLYFTFPDATEQGESLYATDGTAGGTTLLHDFVNANLPYNLLSKFTAVGSELFFGADDVADGPSLWESDGTAAGTTLVKAFGAPPAGAGGPASVGPPILTTTVDGNRLFFTNEPAGPGTPVELWESNGTAAGTTELTDINPGNGGTYPELGDSSGGFAVLGGKLFFANDDPTHGVELWQSDGTAAGTELFLDVNPGAAGSFPQDLAVVANTLYFSATTATGSSELWSSNGTATGTKMVASFDSQPTGSAIFDNIPDAFAVTGNTMVFAADDGTNAAELWETDGTAAGTTMIKVLSQSSLSYDPSEFTTVGTKVFFVVTKGATDELWVSDATTAGTSEVATFDGTIADAMDFDGKLAFIESAPDGTVSSLWFSDGTASGTTEVTSFPSQNNNYGTQTPAMVAADGKLFITAPPLPADSSAGFSTLWVSDGTAAGTMPIPTVPVTTTDDSLVEFRGNVYFSVNTDAGTPRAELWVSDGTVAGTKMLAKLGAPNATIDQFVVAGYNLYIFISQSDNAPEILYKSNGTAKGTVALHSFTNTIVDAASGLPNGNLEFDFNGSLPSYRLPLWVSNGTVAGTAMLHGVSGGFGYLGDGDGAITPINGLFYVQGKDSKGDIGLWQSDGTVAGTTLVQDINGADRVFYPMALTDLNGNLIVAVDEDSQGLELWSGPMPVGAPAVTGQSRKQG